MSFVALVTRRFEEMARFYGDTLGGAETAAWDRPDARGVRFRIHGLEVEVMDAAREQTPPDLGAADDRVHLVFVVPDAAAVRIGGAGAGPVEDTTWGARLVRARDPDGTRLTFLEWTGARN